MVGPREQRGDDDFETLPDSELEFRAGVAAAQARLDACFSLF